MIDGRTHVGLILAVSKFKPARSGAPPCPKQGRRTISKRNHALGVLALTFPAADEPEARRRL